MFETWLSFADYVREYGLERMEGLLLRHLSSVYKVLRQTVPDGMKTDEVVEMELYLRDLVRRVDSSLLEEWERMRDPDFQPARLGRARAGRPRPRRAGRRDAWGTRAGSPPPSARARSRCCARGRPAMTRPRSRSSTRRVTRRGRRGRPSGWRGRGRRSRRSTAACASIPEGRNRRHTHTEPSDDGASWRVEQMLVDVEGHNRLGGRARGRPGRPSRAAAEPVIRLLRLEGLTP